MLKQIVAGSLVLLAATGCRDGSQADGNAPGAGKAAAMEATLSASPTGTSTSIVRLDCGSATVKNFDSFFSDQPGLYPAGPREITDSCYLVTHGDRQLLWDTGFSKSLIGNPDDGPQMRARLTSSIVDQLDKLGLTPADIDIVGISHMHRDHTGQVADFPDARLVIGKSDFEKSAGEGDPFGPWRGTGKTVTATDSDIDIFGDGDVIALFTPGHTPGHHALLVKLESGPVLLSGDLYHSTMAREKRGVPPFNTDRAQTLASMDRFERVAKRLNARVIIQHEPDDIAKLPAFPEAAE